jgi:hypothetical protein
MKAAAVLANHTAGAARGHSRAGIDKDDIRLAFDDRTKAHSSAGRSTGGSVLNAQIDK